MRYLCVSCERNLRFDIISGHCTGLNCNSITIFRISAHPMLRAEIYDCFTVYSI